MIEELSESCALPRQGDPPEQLAQLGPWGLSLAIDDFGSGASNLATPNQLTISTLKLDAHFIQALPADARSRAVVHAVATLAQSLRLRPVAEKASKPKPSAKRWPSLAAPWAKAFGSAPPSPPPNLPSASSPRPDFSLP